MPYIPFATLVLALGVAAAPPPSFLGQDRFDDIVAVAELQQLEHEVVQVTERVRPAVVLLRLRGRNGGMSTGTGVIIRPDGLVATCGHVGGRPGSRVTAVLSDGSELTGRTLGQVFRDGVDCGLIQLDADDRELPVAPLGTTVGLAKGDWIVAFGYTHGSSEASRPALVRVGRVLRNEEKELIFDAPIDAGDSGGPSFNLRGEVVGLNSRCGRQSWENVATPIDQLLQRMKTLEQETEETAATLRDNERERGPATRFPSGGSDAGKLAVQRGVRMNEVTGRAQAALVRVMQEDKPVAYGTVIDGRGLVVTKASQLAPGTALVVQDSNHDDLPAKELARDAASDIALLRVELEKGDTLPSITWEVDTRIAPGSVLLTPRVFPDNPALGFSAIEVRQSEADLIDAPYLGVESFPSTREDLERAGAQRGVTLRRVREGTPAEKAGLLSGDMILQLDGSEVESPNDLRRLLMKRRAGDSVSMTVFGPEGERTVSATLATRGESDRRVRRGNTTTAISRLSSGLGAVIAHDAITNPDQMGGPVVDLDGHVVAFNIARYDRTATHAIPAARMKEICRALIEQARAAQESQPQPAKK